MAERTTRNRTGNSIMLNGGLVVRGTLAAGCGNSVMYENVRQGEEISRVQMPVGTFGHSKQHAVEISGEVIAANAQLNHDNAVLISYKNGPENVSENTEVGADFYRRLQWPVENVVQFSEALNDLAKRCNFSNPEEKLLEQFLYGLRFSEISLKLRKKQGLTLQRAVGFAEAMEDDILASSKTVQSI